MKKVEIIIVLVISFGLLTTCSISKNKDVDKYPDTYIEKILSFYNPNDVDFTYKNWIRKPENILVAHETFKKIGYLNLLDSFWLTRDYTNINYRFVNKPLKELIDSLIVTYQTDTINSLYYYEFWERRENEQNDSIVFMVLKELEQILFANKDIEIKNKFVNDTLFELIKMKYTYDTIDYPKAIKNFNYLKTIGLHQSAYNVLYERYRYYPIKWNADSLCLTLQIDTTNTWKFPWLEDDTK